MLTRQELIRGAISVARDQASQNPPYYTSELEVELTEAGLDCGWSAKVGCTTIYLTDSEVVIRALILRALECNDARVG